MTEGNKLMLDRIRNSFGMRIAVLFGSFFVLLIVTSMLSIGINTIPGISERTSGLIAATIQCLLVFCVPAWILGKYSSGNPMTWLRLKSSPGIKPFIGVLIVYFLFMPAMEWLITWNENLHLPAAMSALEETLRNLENAGNEASAKLLATSGIGGLLSGILVIGILTGFSEEVFFRGGVQGIFIRSSMSSGTAIWVAAFIFSFFHFQFFGFFPRLLMGAFFGYLLVWTKSLWVSIFAHAFNNSLVVIDSANLSGDGKLGDVGNLDMIIGSFNIGPAVSLVATIIFFFFFKNYFFRKS